MIILQVCAGLFRSGRQIPMQRSSMTFRGDVMLRFNLKCIMFFSRTSHPWCLTSSGFENCISKAWALTFSAMIMTT